MSYTVKVPPYRVQTHHAQCWRNASHWACAVNKIESLMALIDEMLAVFQETCDCGECEPCQMAAMAEMRIRTMGHNNGKS